MQNIVSSVIWGETMKKPVLHEDSGINIEAGRHDADNAAGGSGVSFAADRGTLLAAVVLRD